MKPQVLIEKGFSNCFKSIKEIQFSVLDIDNQIYKNIVNLKKIIGHSTIYVDFYENIDKYLYSNVEIETDDEILKAFLKTAINNGMDIKSFKDIQNKNGSVYLKNDIVENCIENENESGIRTLSKNHNFNEEIFPSSFGNYTCSINMTGPGFDKVKHTTKNLVYIDPYFFNNFNNKKINFYNFIRQLIPANCKSPHISIISEKADISKGNYFSLISEKWKEELGYENLEVSIYLPQNKIFDGNRYYITDYCIGALQHLLDREGGIDGNFLYNGDINVNYKEVKNIIDKITVNYTADPSEIGVYALKIGNLIDNPIFY